MGKRILEAWTRLARQIGDFQARVVLTILYVFLLLPFGLTTRLIGDPLRVKRRPVKWLDRSDCVVGWLWARRQW